MHTEPFCHKSDESLSVESHVGHLPDVQPSSEGTSVLALLAEEFGLEVSDSRYTMVAGLKIADSTSPMTTSHLLANTPC